MFEGVGGRGREGVGGRGRRGGVGGRGGRVLKFLVLSVWLSQAIAKVSMSRIRMSSIAF